VKPHRTPQDATSPAQAGPGSATVTLVLLPLSDDDVPVEHRVRALLKTALRRHRLKAVRVVLPLDPPLSAPAAPEGTPHA
jgi:hypothetical protein